MPSRKYRLMSNSKKRWIASNHCTISIRAKIPCGFRFVCLCTIFTSNESHSEYTPQTNTFADVVIFGRMPKMSISSMCSGVCVWVMIALFTFDHHNSMHKLNHFTHWWWWKLACRHYFTSMIQMFNISNHFSKSFFGLVRWLLISLSESRPQNILQTI